jgi:hypothetical protein
MSAPCHPARTTPASATRRRRLAAPHVALQQRRIGWSEARSGHDLVDRPPLVARELEWQGADQGRELVRSDGHRCGPLPGSCLARLRHGELQRQQLVESERSRAAGTSAASSGK